MIRITRLTDYGIVLLSRFVGEADDAVLSARELAAQSGIPLPTVSKILKTLTREGLLVSQRGTQGGYRLAKEPVDITVADIIAALEGPIALTECADAGGGLCEIELTCPMRSNWQRITDAIRSALEAIPLQDMTFRFPIQGSKPEIEAMSDLAPPPRG